MKLILTSICMVVVGCSITTGPDSSSGGSTSSSVPKGSETAPDVGGASKNGGAPNGSSCSSAASCAYYYCKCSDGAVVNSRACVQGSCQLPSAHCGDACTAFKHGAWSGVAGGGDGATSSSSSSSSSSGSAGTCTDKSQCPSYTCGCMDGSRISVRECLGGSCTSPSTGCQSACEDSGRGDWDGT